MDTQELTNQCCRADVQTAFINQIVELSANIAEMLFKINSITNNNPQDDLRNFENIAKTRYYANQIQNCADRVKKQTMDLEDDLIYWGDSRTENDL